MSRVILPAAQRYARMAAATPSAAPKAVQDLMQHSKLARPAVAKAMDGPAKEGSGQEAAEAARLLGLEMAARRADHSA